jgi:hypothetical protein
MLAACAIRNDKLHKHSCRAVQLSDLPYFRTSATIFAQPDILAASNR